MAVAAGGVRTKGAEIRTTTLSSAEPWSTLTEYPFPRYPMTAVDASLLDATDLATAIDALAQGDPEALDEVFHLAYDDLRTLARARLREKSDGDHLDTTALVHEAFLRVRGADRSPRWSSPTHFFAFASKAMRHILVDHARRRNAQIRGGPNTHHVTLNSWIISESSDDPVDLVELDRALKALGEQDPRLERVVECRFFSGLTSQETADTLGVSLRTVERDWLKARTYLRRLMTP